MVDVGRDLWRSSGSVVLLEQNHLEMVDQDHVQTFSNTSKNEDSEISQGNLCQ